MCDSEILCILRKPVIYALSIAEINGHKGIYCANHSNEFVEIVLSINGREVRTGNPIDSKTRGYAFPPRFEKVITKSKDNQSLELTKKGNKIEARIFTGYGEYVYPDLNTPTFLRNQVSKKVKFKRHSNQPIQVLQASTSL